MSTNIYLFNFVTVTKTIKTSVHTTLRGMAVLTGLDEAEPLRLAASQCFVFSMHQVPSLTLVSTSFKYLQSHQSNYSSERGAAMNLLYIWSMSTSSKVI